MNFCCWWWCEWICALSSRCRLHPLQVRENPQWYDFPVTSCTGCPGDWPLGHKTRIGWFVWLKITKVPAGSRNWESLPPRNFIYHFTVSNVCMLTAARVATHPCHLGRGEAGTDECVSSWNDSAAGRHLARQVIQWCPPSVATPEGHAAETIRSSYDG